MPDKATTVHYLNEIGCMVANPTRHVMQNYLSNKDVKLVKPQTPTESYRLDIMQFGVDPHDRVDISDVKFDRRKLF